MFTVVRFDYSYPLIEIVPCRVYEFTTEQKCVYVIHMDDITNYIDFGEQKISGQVLSFSIYPKQSLKVSNRDIKIRNTLRELFKFLLNNSTLSIIIWTDNLDGKQLIRKRLFSIWFNNLYESSILKIDDEIIHNNEITYTSLFIHKDNQDLKILLENFTKLKIE